MRAERSHQRIAGQPVIAALVLWLLLGTGCARVAPDVTPTGPIVLAALTWNMDAGQADLPRLLDDLASGRLTSAPPPDYLVLLQEAVEGGERDVRAIAAARGLSAFYSPVRRTAAFTSGNAVVSSLALMGPRVIDLPRERQPRTAIAATIQVAGEEMFVVSAHLENRLAWLRGLFGDRARGRQTEALLAALPLRGHGIVGGDMNTMLGPDEPAWRRFLTRFPDTPPARQPTFRQRLVLDHLFFDLPAGWAVTQRVVPERYGSDHHPVLGVVRLR